jgi:hypothetical protein
MKEDEGRRKEEERRRNKEEEGHTRLVTETGK